MIAKIVITLLQNLMVLVLINAILFNCVKREKKLPKKVESSGTKTWDKKRPKNGKPSPPVTAATPVAGSSTKKDSERQESDPKNDSKPSTGPKDASLKVDQTQDIDRTIERPKTHQPSKITTLKDCQEVSALAPMNLKTNNEDFDDYLNNLGGGSKAKTPTKERSGWKSPEN